MHTKDINLKKLLPELKMGLQCIHVQDDVLHTRWLLNK